jgi:enoyl-[acyl-carrier protein] reductase I
MTQTLACKKGLVVGIANEHSIAWGCAKAFQAEGAELAVTYLNVKAEPYVRPLAQQVGASIILPLDVRDDLQMEAVFNAVKAKWGSSISCYMRLRSRRKRICMAAWQTVHGRGF